jgi:hypothetical protein
VLLAVLFSSRLLTLIDTSLYQVTVRTSLPSTGQSNGEVTREIGTKMRAQQDLKLVKQPNLEQSLSGMAQGIISVMVM